MKMAIQICHEFAVMWAQQAMGGDRSGASDHKEAAAREIIEELRKVNAAEPSQMTQSEPIGEVVGEQRIGFQILPLVAWNKDVVRGTKLYATPQSEQALRALTNEQRQVIAEVSTALEMQAEHERNMGIYEGEAVFDALAKRLDGLLTTPGAPNETNLGS